MGFNRAQLLTTTVLASLLLVAPSLASAEVFQSTPTTPQTEKEADQEETRAAQVEDIVVTGSRLRRNAFTSTQPISVITAEQSALEGLIDTTEILQSSTAAATSGQINNYFTGYVNAGGAGANTISLRGLGANRTLVLINGRRMGPAGISGQVGPTDLNTIPSGQIDRIEILTDGASSIYGSDAVGGVINVITKTTQNGGRASVHATVPFESGGEEFRIEGSHGWTSARGYLTVGGEYYERKPLLFGDREAFRCPQSRIYYDPGLKIRADVIDPRTNDYKCDSAINNMVMAFRFNGVTRPSYEFQRAPNAVNNGGLVGCDIPGWRFNSGGLGTACNNSTKSTAVQRELYAASNTHSDRYDSRTIISPAKRYGLSAFGGFDLTANTEIFGELMFVRRESSQSTWQQLFPTVVFGAEGYPIPGISPLAPLFDYAYPVAYVPQDGSQTVDYTRAVAGIRGKLSIGRGLDWELAAQYSRSDAEYVDNAIYADRVFATAGYHDGLSENGVTIIPAGLSQGADRTEFNNTGCITAWLRTATACPSTKINWFTEDFLRDGKLPAEHAAFIFARDRGTTVYTHAYVEGLISGDLFDLPAGTVGAALGFQYRKEEIDDTPGSLSINNNSWGRSTAGRTKGSDTIKEVFAEIEIPLLANLPIVDRLTLNASGRYSDYDSYGDNSTYKVGFNWAITPEYRLRGSYGTAFRAPALYELYLADQTSFVGQANIDPCINWPLRTDLDVRTNCQAEGIPDTYNGAGSASARVLGGGGAGNLQAETADTISAGFIWTPSFAKLNVALDYFKVTINDQVARYGAGNIVTSCYGFGGYRDPNLCSLFDRAPADSATPHQITTVRDSYINIAEQMSEGLDLKVNYDREFGFGDLTLGAEVSYILDWTTQLANASSPSDQLDFIGNPEWTANLTALFKHKDWTFVWNTSIIPEVTNVRSSKSGAIFGEAVYLDTTADTTLYHGLTVRKQADKWTFTAGINNIFDENAPWTSASGGSRGAGNVPLTSQYDYLGRRAFLSITRSW